MEPTVNERLYEVALAKGLRQSTLLSYRRLLGSARDTKPTASGLTKPELASVRAWATKEGKEVSNTGRVPKALIDGWKEAGSPAA